MEARLSESGFIAERAAREMRVFLVHITCIESLGIGAERDAQSK
jgi:hypothetical protein